MRQAHKYTVLRQWRASSARADKRSRGQTMVWVLAALAVSAAVMYGVFNLTQLSVAKERAVNTADAAALAGSTVQARLLNLVAYNNRAMIANEVFLIQMISIQSWLQYVGKTANNFGTVANMIGIFVPPVAVIGNVLKQIGSAIDKVQEGLGKANDAIVKLLELSKNVIYAAHTVVLNTGGLIAQDAAKAVISANRSEFGVHKDAGVQLDNHAAVTGLTFVANNQRWMQFTKLYQGQNRGDARDVLLASRDEFSTSRPGAWWQKIPLTPFLGTEKNGGSELKNFDRWQTQDTFEIWTKGKRKIYAPIGWGRSNADQNGTKGDTMSPGRAAQSMARSQGSTHSGWSGVPKVYDISDKDVKSRETKLKVDFLIAVRRPQANQQTTTQMGIAVPTASPLGSPAMAETLEEGQLSAISKARVSFERPKRGLANDTTASSLWREDSAKEYGSLFSPYWQARLVDLSPGEKIALYTAMGITPDKSLYTPGGQ